VLSWPFYFSSRRGRMAALGGSLEASAIKPNGSILELFSRAGLAGKEEDDEIRLVGGEMVAFVKSFLPPPVTPV